MHTPQFLVKKEPLIYIPEIKKLGVVQVQTKGEKTKSKMAIFISGFFPIAALDSFQALHISGMEMRCPFFSKNWGLCIFLEK